MNTKGFVGDVLLWGVMLVTIIAIAFLLYLLLSGAGNSISATDQPVMNAGVTTATNSWAKGWDFAIVAGFGAMLLVSLSSAWMVGTNSMFFWITLIILIIMITALAALNNIAYSLFSSDTFMVVRSQMPGTNFIIEHLFALCVGGAGMLLLVLFAKNRGEQG